VLTAQGSPVESPQAIHVMHTACLPGISFAALVITFDTQIDSRLLLVFDRWDAAALGTRCRHSPRQGVAEASFVADATRRVVICCLQIAVRGS
jgi:hypothetical protein